MSSSWLVLALAFALVTAAAGVLYLGMRGDARGEGGPAGGSDRADPPDDDPAG